MKKYFLLFTFSILCITFLKCSTVAPTNDEITSDNLSESGFSLNKKSNSSKILVISPTSPTEISFEVIEETSQYSLTRITGVKDYVVQSGGKQLVTGNINYIIVRRNKTGGVLSGSTYLTEVNGTVTTEQVNGNSPEDYYSGQILAFGGSECGEDSDCDGMWPQPPYTTGCVNGSCKYIDQD